MFDVSNTADVMDHPIEQAHPTLSVSSNFSSVRIMVNLATTAITGSTKGRNKKVKRI